MLKNGENFLTSDLDILKTYFYIEKPMNISYLSDTHWDFWVNAFLPEDTQKFQMRNILEPRLPEIRDVIVVAGDLGHSDNQNFLFLEVLREYYNHVLYVVGNHDLYLIPEYTELTNSFDRVKRLANAVREKLTNVHFLNGQVVEIDGVKFGGNSMWFDDTYCMDFFRDRFGFPADSNPVFFDKFVDDLWKQNLNDFDHIKGIGTWRSYFENKLKDLQQIINEIDVVITHYGPTPKEHVPIQYRGQATTSFFRFDEKWLKNYDLTSKLYFYGHTHNKLDYVHGGCRYLVNPMGYPSEWRKGSFDKFKIETVEV